MAARRYLLLVSGSTGLTRVLRELLSAAGVSEPLETVTSDAEGAAAVNRADLEPPLAVFVDMPSIENPLRLIGWIVSSPSTHLIPVFAITGASGPQRLEVEDYKPTAIISHPLSPGDIAYCVKKCPLLRPGEAGNPKPRQTGSANPLVLFC